MSMKTSTSLNQLSGVLSKYLEQFPGQEDLPLPELTGAPPLSPKDSLKFGVSVISNEGGGEQVFTVRRNLIGETWDSITKASLLALKPRLEVEDPEGREALQKGSYTIRCVGWEVVDGQKGSAEQRASVKAVVTSVLRT